MRLRGLLQELIVAGLQLLFVGLNIVQQMGFERPPKEVELSDRRDKGFIVLNAELDSLPPAVRVKILLVIGIQLTLIGLVDNEALAVQFVGREVLATELGYEPVDHTQRDLRIPDQIRHDLCHIGIGGIEPLERCDDQLGLAVNLLASRLRIGCIGLLHSSGSLRTGNLGSL